MISSQVWTALVNTLQNDPVLSNYIKYVYQRLRFDVTQDNFPCLMLEPVSNNEIEKDMNQVKDVFFSVNLYAFSSASDNDFTKAVVGDADYKGILDIENDIRACLQSSYTLGDNVIDTQVGVIQFGTPEIADKYPISGMIIPLKILYRQINGA